MYQHSVRILKQRNHYWYAFNGNKNHRLFRTVNFKLVNFCLSFFSVFAVSQNAKSRFQATQQDERKGRFGERVQSKENCS